MTFSVPEFWICTKCRTQAYFSALCTIVARKFEHQQVSQKVRGNTGIVLIVSAVRILCLCSIIATSDMTKQLNILQCSTSK